LLLPRWRRLVVYARGIDRSPLNWTERLLCYLCLARFAFVPRKWEALAGDLVRAAKSIPSLYVANRLKREETRRRSVPES
jgi:hypothetical protein